MVGSPAVRVVVRIGLFSVEQAAFRPFTVGSSWRGQQRDDGLVAGLDVVTVEFGVGPGDKGTVHVHGVVGWKPRFHAEVVIVLTVHHGGVNHARSVGRRDPIGLEHGPCRRGIALGHGTREQRFVGPPDEVSSRELVNDVDVVTQDLLHEVLGEDDLLPNVRTACAFPMLAGGFLDATSDVGDLRSNGQTHVARKRPRRGRPCEDGGVVVGEFEFDIHRGFFHFFVAQRHLVAGVRRPGLRTEREHLVASVEQPFVEHLFEGPPR